MDPHFWLQRWQEQAIGFHQEDINRYLTDFWERLSLAKDATVLVPLCGKSKDMVWLRDQGYQVIGVEISDIAVRDFFSENGIEAKRKAERDFVVWQAPGIRIYQGDFFNLTEAELSDVQAVFDRAALIALPEPMRQAYVTKLQACLPASAPILLITLQYPQTSMQGPPFSVSDNEVKNLYHDFYGIECCCEVDALAMNPQFRDRGLDELLEMVYLLRPKN